ncbi:hypothetical protein BH11PAT1_BH11PAT1_2540 [soil metagenome]
MAHRPFFSIIIPTYNNSHSLHAAIQICLAQTFKDFEVVVIDDCSPDNTKEIVAKIKDKRVRYVRNTKNLGQEGNFKKSFSMGDGKYLFISGDDDYILWPDTLEKVHSIIQKEGYGFVRLNLIERKFVGKGLRKSIINYEKDKIIQKDMSAEKIIDFFRIFAVGHMAGLIFKNEGDMGKKLFNLQETPWMKILYEATKKDGAIYLGKQYMVITWSQRAIFSHYNVKNRKPIMIEDYTNYIFSLIPEKYKDEYKWRYYSGFAWLQPAIKLYSNNHNMLAFDKRLFLLEPRLKRSSILWILFCFSWVLPKSFWNLVRTVQHQSKNHLSGLNNVKTIEKRFNYLEERYLQ